MPQGKSIKQNNVGFTLLEVMIALLILAISLTAVYTALTQGIRNVNHLENKMYAQWVGMNILTQFQTGIKFIPRGLPREQGDGVPQGGETGNRRTTEDVRLQAGAFWQSQKESRSPLGSPERLCREERNHTRKNSPWLAMGIFNKPSRDLQSTAGDMALFNRQWHWQADFTSLFNGQVVEVTITVYKEDHVNMLAHVEGFLNAAV